MNANTLTFVLGLILATPAFATTHQQSGAANASPVTSAEVRKVDKGAKKITLKHQAIKNLDMPPMTMVFPVKDEAMLERVKQGDKVTFTAEKVGGTITVMSIDPVK